MLACVIEKIFYKLKIMGLYYRKRIKILPGVHMNLSKSGTSLSVGRRGASVNFGKKGTYMNVGIPGTGIYSRTRISQNPKQPPVDNQYNAWTDPKQWGCVMLLFFSFFGIGFFVVGNFKLSLCTFLLGFLLYLFITRKKKTNIPMSKNPKQNIEDFFKIDIHNLFEYNPEYIGTSTSVTGNEVTHYKLRLKELELGQFFEIEMIEPAAGEFNLIFKGRNNILTKEIEEFVAFCTNLYGLDDLGYGRIEDTDKIQASRNVFSRMWKDIWIGNMAAEKLEMTLFGIKMNKIVNQGNENQEDKVHR